MNVVKYTIFEFLLHKVRILEIPFRLRHWSRIRLAIFLLLDCLIVCVSYYLAFFTRLDNFFLGDYFQECWQTMPIMAGISLLTFYFLGVYRQLWRHANFNSGIIIVKSVIITVVVFSAIMAFSGSIFNVPRSIPIIFACYAIMGVASYKFFFRILISIQASLETPDKQPCLVYGAGTSGELFVRYIKNIGKSSYNVIGFIDDDRNLKNKVIYDVKVLGSGVDLWRLTKLHNIHTIIIAIHSAPGHIVARIFNDCKEAGLEPLIMPNMSKNLATKLVEPRPIEINDLLRRSPKMLKTKCVENLIKHQSILVTGAGGSIGAELSRQLLALSPSQLILLDACEYNLYKIELELAGEATDGTEIIPVLGSVTSKRFIYQVFQKYRPDVVFHAAAYKHVPMVEKNPIEGIINNVLGTKTVCDAAVAFGIERLLLISTDKAVKPTNVMGATKRVCEVYVQAMHKLHCKITSFSLVRFGNVLGSSGSVIPLFLDQIQNGGPITITHPEVTRYFMVTSEAIGLVLQSLALSKGGETYVLNMGQPKKIYDMACQLIKLAGKKPHEDIEIVYSGLRPGEKMYEELLLEGTETPTILDDLFIAKSDIINPKLSIKTVDELIYNASQEDIPKCKELLNIICEGKYNGNCEETPIQTSVPVKTFAPTQMN